MDMCVSRCVSGGSSPPVVSLPMGRSDYCSNAGFRRAGARPFPAKKGGLDDKFKDLRRKASNIFERVYNLGLSARP